MIETDITPQATRRISEDLLPDIHPNLFSFD